jgi:hypothetical protein
LLAAVGGLSMQRLGLNVMVYDPQVHYQQVRDAWIGGAHSGRQIAGLFSNCPNFKMLIAPLPCAITELTATLRRACPGDSARARRRQSFAPLAQITAKSSEERHGAGG